MLGKYLRIKGQHLPFHSVSTANLMATHQKTGFPGGTVVKYLPASAGDTRDLGLIPGSERSPRGGNGNSLQYSPLKNPMDRGTWATVHGVAKSDMTEHAHTHQKMAPPQASFPFLQGPDVVE